MAARYAIYYAPQDASPLAAFGRHWLGRCAATGEAMVQPELPGIHPDRVAEATAEPRRYGFHATLKPPFRLAPGRRVEDLVEAADVFAGARRPVVAPPLAVRALGRFVALVPGGACPALDDLAADCVRGFDGFRAPAEEGELARRRAAGLTPVQDAYLAAWGYPYVMEEFRFHLTLTGPLPDEGERGRFLAALNLLTTGVRAEPLRVDGIALFEEPEPGAPFRLRSRFAFTG